MTFKRDSSTTCIFALLSWLLSHDLLAWVFSLVFASKLQLILLLILKLGLCLSGSCFILVLQLNYVLVKFRKKCAFYQFQRNFRFSISHFFVQLLLVHIWGKVSNCLPISLFIYFSSISLLVWVMQIITIAESRITWVEFKSESSSITRHFLRFDWINLGKALLLFNLCI